MSSSKIESGVQLFSRVNCKTFLEDFNSNFFPEGGPYLNEIIEITGNPSMDKNDLLIDFIVKCILPSNYSNEWKGSGVIFVNTEFQINLFKIIKVIEILIENHHITEPKKIIIENALKNLTILNCYNSEDLEVTFYYLEKLIHSNKSINLVVLDNINAHFWVSKFSTNMLSYYQHSLNNFVILQNVIKNLQVLLIFVRHSSTKNKKRFSQKIDYKIEVEKDGTNFKATLTNYGKQTEQCAFLKLKPVLEFL